MPSLPGQHCENCLKHVAKKNHPGNERCTECLPEDGELRRCDGCRMARYCVSIKTNGRDDDLYYACLRLQSRSCQKAHWKTHKRICRLTVNNRRRAELAGLSTRRQALQDWVFKNNVALCIIGVNALGLHSDRERGGTRNPSYPNQEEFAHNISTQRRTFSWSTLTTPSLHLPVRPGGQGSLIPSAVQSACPSPGLTSCTPLDSQGGLLRLRATWRLTRGSYGSWLLMMDFHHPWICFRVLSRLAKT